MLEKKSKKDKIIYCDAHFHLEDYDLKNCFASCSCGKMIRAFGIHPQNPDLAFLPLLENLLESKEIQAVGECGFDFYKSENYAMPEVSAQTEAFVSQIILAQKYNLPVVIHCRKANEKLFEYSSELKKLPSVLFHSFMGTVIEANSLLNRGINGYFSFGKQIFNGNKKVIQCVKELPIERLLLETDAPFQTLKGEEKTFTSEIRKIYEGAFKLRFDSVANDVAGFFDFADKLKRNFTECFCNPL